MLITNLKINNFRNYENLNISFNKKINLFYGNNAQGKTNILEAIYLTSIGKSFRTKKDSDLIKIGNDRSVIEVEYLKKDRDGKIKIEIFDKKNIYINGIKLKKYSELLGNINVVIFTPDDINILKGGPSERRRFLDIMIGQLKPIYIYYLNLYLKTLEQRNNYLRQIKYENKDENLLDIWDEKLAEYAEKVCFYRVDIIDKIKNKIKKIHKNITNEDIEIVYNTECKNKEEYIKQLKFNRKIDILKGYTNKGIHRDDFYIKINNQDIKTYGSQGQNRTAVLSLKMAELQVVYDEIGEYPILLLDDFMSELDFDRRKNFIESIKDIQVFITCTDKIELNKEIDIYEVEKGKISKNTCK